jgi:hypothetical protein
MRPSYSWSRSPERPKASRRELNGVEGFSRIVKPNKKLQRYGLRKRTARHMTSDEKSLEHASRHLNVLKKPKRTPTFKRAQLLALQVLLLALWLLGLRLLLLALQ